ncbi:MAG: hypothetical protein DWQ01_02090 [Planctomycetota bacterium]|nr:MAG: hypothetical protein DWQ01_02090 [Planctomycetota bacterium]
MDACLSSEELLDSFLNQARKEGRESLLEPEGYRLLQSLGLPVPRHAFFRGAKDLEDFDPASLRSGQVVMKVVSPRILHKTEVGGVRLLPASLPEILASMREMEQALQGQSVSGFLLSEYWPHQQDLGGQLLFGVRWTTDFGAVLVFGAGGIQTEFLAEALREDKALVCLTPGLTPPGGWLPILEQNAAFQMACRPFRGQAPRLQESRLLGWLVALAEFAQEHMPHRVRELEINPMAIGPQGTAALDVLVKLGGGGEPLKERIPRRPLHKMRHLLKPRSMAVVGVSERMNPGHVILRNTLREGFPAQKLYVVKPGLEQLDGCPCVPDLAALPEKVDLLVLSVGAAQVPDLVQQCVELDRAESLIVIPGGLGELEGSETLVARVLQSLEQSRHRPGGGPLLNGGNSLGLRSTPGCLDTLFIPESKLPFPDHPADPVAILSQSGAFAIARSSALANLNPRYLITAGNQLDLTVGDYLHALKDDPEIRVFACYVEGFRPLDGRRFLQAAAEITASGRQVLLYRAGRTPAGAAASASHTASLAGDFRITRELAASFGVLVAPDLATFEDLLALSWRLDGRAWQGLHVGLMSNAGFECVAMADQLGPFRLPRLAPETRSRLEAIFEQSRLTGIVVPQNPLDVTPMMGDAAFEACARTLLEDPQVDLGVISCVPLTPALRTLARSEGHREDLLDEGAVARRLIRLWQESEKPWVAVVDSGPLYRPLADALKAAGLPVFEKADRALQCLAFLARARFPREGKSSAGDPGSRSIG